MDKENNANPHMFKNKSKWYPQPNTEENGDFEAIMKMMTDATKNPIIKNKIKSNMHTKEKQALSSLKENTKIIIQKADKGGGMVIMNIEDYKYGILSILEDKNTYVVEEQFDPQKLANKVQSTLNNWKLLLTKKESEYLTEYDKTVGHIYGLPKIHKCRKLKELIVENLENAKSQSGNTLQCKWNDHTIPFRPILSATKDSISRLCELAKLILRPLELKIPHLVRDTFDFLRWLPTESDKNSTLIAVDIVKLYPSIRNSLGLEAISYWATEYPELLDSKFDNDAILQILKFIQDNVYFEFDGTTYKQVEGTAMGKNHAPQYANLIVAYLLITKLFPNLYSKYPTEQVDRIKQNLKMFLDDGFCIIPPDSEITPEILLSEINSLDQDIQFTMESSKSHIPFLDVLVTLDQSNGKIETETYSKPTDTYNYYPFYSCGPGHIARNIPINLAKRICTICSEVKSRDANLEKLKVRLLRLKYPTELVDNSISNAKEISRIDLLKIKEKPAEEQETLAYLTNFNPKVKDQYQTIKPMFDLLQNTNKVTKVAKKRGLTASNTVPRLVNANRQPPNLYNLLGNKFHTYTNKVDKLRNFKTCKDKRCKICKQVIPGTEYTTKNGTRLYRNRQMTCKIRDIVYLIVCPTCKTEYIGETGDQLNERMNTHRSQMTHERYRFLRCSKHFHECGKDHFLIYPFYSCRREDPTFRLKKEQEFINLVKPGLN